MPPGLDYDNLVEYTRRLLEVIEVGFGLDGEKYAEEVVNLLKHVDPPSLESQQVLEPVVEKILSFIRDSMSFCIWNCKSITELYV